MDRIAGRESGYQAITRGAILVVAILCAACVVVASEASAQCTARDVLQNRLTLRPHSSPNNSPVLIKSASAVPVWKTITIGTFANSFALLNALNAAGCGIGDLAYEVLARPAFKVSNVRTNVELFVVSAAELDFLTDTVPLADIYARAQRLGFGLAAAEVAPQLRLQYFDQPMGAFLIGMEPIKTWDGAPAILSVANGGAGLVLVGRDGSAAAEVPVQSRFIFVRSKEAALVETLHVSP
jgi:hypothetical protein